MAAIPDWVWYWFPVWQPPAIAVLAYFALGCIRYWWEVFDDHA